MGKGYMLESEVGTYRNALDLEPSTPEKNLFTQKLALSKTNVYLNYYLKTFYLKTEPIICFKRFAITNHFLNRSLWTKALG